ncbi:MAG: polyphosphate polymerase domain-containing protein [Lachnospiraceae bacterium]|nr:polyphosphate polymerase domain-containing protein [Lachnospiraceae bacterium]
MEIKQNALIATLRSLQGRYKKNGNWLPVPRHFGDSQGTAEYLQRKEDMAFVDTFRYEYKCFGPDISLKALEMRLQGLMNRDQNVGPDGSYLVRSIYFDSFDDRFLLENINGVDPREKFRIRSYNRDSSRISLELKRRERGKIGKKSELLDKEEFDALIFGNYDFNEKDGFLLKRLKALHKSELVSPKVMVEYRRWAYTYPVGNVRVTFDRMISASSEIGRFFEEDSRSRPVLRAGMSLMEIKFDWALPDFINDALYNEELSPSTFSKYYLCRRFQRNIVRLPE